MDKYKRLAKDTIIYLIGSFGNKVVSLVMLSFYTFKISTEDYGKIDMTLATLSLLMPLICLCMHDATLRFSIENPKESDGVISNALCSVFIATIVFIPLSFLLYYFGLLHGNFLVILTLILLEGFSLCLSQYSRAVGNQVAYATSGIIGTFALTVSNIALLSFFENKIIGYFISIIISYLSSCIFLVVSGKVWRHFSLRKLDFPLYKEMLKFSLPMIPNALLWWIMSVSDKYTLLFFCGVAANGLYGVAGKIPLIITTFTNTVMTAWGNSAILEGNSKNKDEFQTKIFALLSSFYFIGISAILVVLKLLTKYLLGAEYSDSWKYVPFLLLSAMFSGFSSFLATEYVVKKKTMNTLKTTALGAIANIIVNIPLVYFCGINGATIATMISYILTWLIRIKDTKGTLKIKYDIPCMVVSIVLISIQIVLVYFTEGILQISLSAAILLVVLAVNYKAYKPILMRGKAIVLAKRRFNA